MLKLWLDDVRDPRDPFIQATKVATPDMAWVKTVPEAVVMLLAGDVDFMSLAHDLGEGQPTGYDLAKWVERRARGGQLVVPDFSVHSDNPVGREKTLVALNNTKLYSDDFTAG